MINSIKSRLFYILCLTTTVFGIFILIFILATIAMQGYEYLSWDFLIGTSSRHPEQAGILPALLGSLYILLLAILVSVPLGVGTAIFLEEYASSHFIIKIMRFNIRNLVGVPAIVYGILGVTLYVRVFDLGRSIISGGLTIAFLMLPIITIATQEALKSVPNEIRKAGYSLGLTRWKIIRHLVIPATLPGFLTGLIISIARVIGEASPLILVGAVAYITFLPVSPFDQFTVLPIQIFNWAGKAIKEFHSLSASASIILILMLFILNSIAVIIRARQRNKL